MERAGPMSFSPANWRRSFPAICRTFLEHGRTLSVAALHKVALERFHSIVGELVRVVVASTYVFSHHTQTDPHRRGCLRSAGDMIDSSASIPVTRLERQ
jgi:hypothetical protein